MKFLPLLLSLAVSAPGLAQDSPPAQQPPAVRRLNRDAPGVVLDQTIPVASAKTPPAPEKETPRFNLDFPGGTPAELAGAITKAMGRRLNLIIPESRKDVRIMPIRVEQVTLRELFQAISTASVERIAVPTGSNGIDYRDAQMHFLCSGDAADSATTWAFFYNGPTEQELSVTRQPAAEAAVRYFQLGPWLERFSIEDITTAIQTGWKMKGVDASPKLSFHEETGLLIAVGNRENLDMITEVLNHLPSGPKPAPTPAAP